MISQAHAEESVIWFLANARKLGEARFKLTIAESRVKRVRAIMMKKFGDLPVAAQQREADASDEMLKAWEMEAQAAGAFEELKALRDGHTARLELFRTLESTARQVAREATHGPRNEP